MEKIKQNVKSTSTTVSPTKEIAIYLRVSTEKQNKNTSKETQLNAINNYLNANNLQHCKKHTYEDKESASKNVRSTDIDDDRISSRPGLNQLIFDARLKKFDTVLVFSHDRLTRNVHESLILKYLFSRLKISLIYCRAGEELNSENKKFNDFFDHLLNNLSQLESNLISSRTRLGNEYNIKHNYWAGGPPPYGYKLVPAYPGSKKSVLEVVYSEARLVRDIFNYYANGYSPKAIAKLITEKYPYNNDRKWTTNTIKSILNNKDYTGILVWNKKGGARNPVKHDNPIYSPAKNEENVIISEALWEYIEKLRKIIRESPKTLSSPFILRGLIKCGLCGKLMQCKNNGGNRGRVYYCMNEQRKWELCLKADIIEKNIIKRIGEELTLMLKEDGRFDAFYEKYLKEFKSRQQYFENQEKELEEQLKNNEDLLIKCNSEISIFGSDLNISNKEDYDKKLKFLEMLKEFKSYLEINNDLLKSKLKDVKDNLLKPCIDMEAMKRSLSVKSNMLESIRKQISDEQVYKRNLRIIFFDLIDKVEVSESGNKIDITFK